MPGTAIAGEDARERAWRDAVADALRDHAPTAEAHLGVALSFVLHSDRVRLDLDNLVRPALDALRDSGAALRGFSNVDAVLATKSAGEEAGLRVTIGKSGLVSSVDAPGAMLFTARSEVIPRDGSADSKMQWRQAVAASWAALPIPAGAVFVDIATSSELSLKDILKPVIDGLEPVLGRDPRGRLEFCPQDERVVWLRAQRADLGQGALNVQVGRVEGENDDQHLSPAT